MRTPEGRIIPWNANIFLGICPWIKTSRVTVPALKQVSRSILVHVLFVTRTDLSSFSLYSWMLCVPWRWTAPWTLSTITAPFSTLGAGNWKPALTRVWNRLIQLQQALFSKYPTSSCCWCSSWEQFSSHHSLIRQIRFPTQGVGGYALL